jgi:DUF917 family protein
LTRTLGEGELENIMLGAEILGCGGGGTVESGRQLVREVFELGKKPRIQDIDKVSSDEMSFVVSGVGGGVAKKELAKLEGYTASPRKPTRLQTFVDAVRLLAEIFTEPRALLASEVGAGNLMVPIAASAILEAVTVDADCCGRAKPEVAISTTTLRGIEASPMAVVSPFGERIVFRSTVDDIRAEQLVRACASVSGGGVACARSAMNGETLKKSTVKRSISYALRLGEKVREYRDRDKSVTEILQRDFGFKEIFRGKIHSWVRRSRDAFMMGYLALKGSDIYQNRVMRIDFKNEYLVAFLDNHPFVTCPDLITVIDLETQRPLSNWSDTRMYANRSVAVLYKKADQIWHTKKGLDLFSPTHFGYPFGYTNSVELHHVSLK